MKRHTRVRVMQITGWMLTLSVFVIVSLMVITGMSAADDRQHQPLRMGLPPMDNAVKTVKKWQPLTEYLAKKLNRPIEIEIEPDYQSIVKRMSRAEVHIGLMGSFIYVQTYAKGNFVPLVRRVMNGSSSYSGIIVVRKDSNIQSLAGLRGKSFAFTDKNSTTGYALPVVHLKKSGFGSPNDFFSNVIFTGNHDSALLAVSFGAAAGAAVTTTRFTPENTHFDQLKIIWESEKIPLGPFVAVKEMGASTIAELRRAFFDLGSSLETRELLRNCGVDRFEPADNRDYVKVRAILKSMKGWHPED